MGMLLKLTEGREAYGHGKDVDGRWALKACYSFFLRGCRLIQPLNTVKATHRVKEKRVWVR